MDGDRGAELKLGLALDYLDHELPLERNFEILGELVHAARDAGFHLIYHAHHFMESECPRFQPLPVLSRFAGESGDMLMLYADILPLNNPIRVAEELATFDVMTGGRALLLGVLGYQHSEFEAFGVPRSRRAERLCAVYETVARLLAGERVTLSQGGYELDDVELGGLLHSISRPRPPIWITAHNDRGVRRAAHHGDAWFISHQPRLPELEVQVPHYHEWRSERDAEAFHACELHGIRLPLLREGFVAQTTEDAIRLAAGPIMESVGEYRRTDQLGELKDAATYELPFDEWRVDRAVIGDPDAVAADLLRYQERLGVDCVVLKLHRKGIPFERVLESIALVGEHVIPRLGGRAAATTGDRS